jgi:hypothetical protein
LVFHCTTHQAFYWTFGDFPHWYRARVRTGWFVLCFLEQKIAHRVKGGMSSVITRVLRIFFGNNDNEFSFSRTGITFPCGGSSHTVVGDFCCWLADERALKDFLAASLPFVLLAAMREDLPLLCLLMSGHPSKVNFDFCSGLFFLHVHSHQQPPPRTAR